MAFRDANIKPIEPRFSEDVAQFRSLHAYFLTKASEAKRRLLGEADPVIIEDPIPDEPAPAPSQNVRPQAQPERVSDNDILRANEDGTAQYKWPATFPEYVKGRDNGKDMGPQFLPDIDPFTGEEI